VIKRAVMLLSALALGLLMPTAAQAQTSGPSEVFVGAYLNDVKDVDLSSNSYDIDLYLWLRWSNPDIDPSKSIHAMNPKDAWLTTELLFDEPTQLSDGSYYNVIRYLGGFSGKLALHDYPFDRQVLTIVLEDSELTTADLVFVPDPLSATVTNPDLAIPGWQADALGVRVVNEPYPSTWGNTDATGNEAYSRVLIELPVHRPVVSSAIKMFFPLATVLLTSVLAFFLKPSMVESKVGTAITALLTLVALQFTVMGSLPPVGYLTMIEVIYALSFLFVLYTLGVSIYTAWSERDPDSPEAVRFDRRTLTYGFVAYLVTIAATLVGFLA
jgi:hypothetical protein